VGRPVRALGFTGTGLGLGLGTPTPAAMPLPPALLLVWCPVCASCFSSSLKLLLRLLPIKRPGPKLPPPTTLPAGGAALSSSMDSRIKFDPFMPPGELFELLAAAFLRAYTVCFIKSSPACAAFPPPTMMPRSISYEKRGCAVKPPLPGW